MKKFVPFPPVCENKYNRGDHVLVWHSGEYWPTIAIIDTVYRIQRNGDKPICKYDAHNAVDQFENLLEVDIYPDTEESRLLIYKEIIRDQKRSIERYKNSIVYAQEHIDRVRAEIKKHAKEN